VGKDGEKNLVEKQCCEIFKLLIIRCFRALQQNIEMHLRGLQFPQSAIKEYEWSKSNGTYHEGFV
jgi:hypothetical protein